MNTERLEELREDIDLALRRFIRDARRDELGGRVWETTSWISGLWQEIDDELDKLTRGPDEAE